MEVEENVRNVRWLDHGQNMQDIQKSLYLSSSLFDCVISVGENRFKAHQLILLSCSEFFVEILSNCPPNIVPTLIIPDLNPKLVEPLLIFMYTGETFISSNSLPDFLDACSFLKIRGFISCDSFVNGIKVEKIGNNNINETIMVQSSFEELVEGTTTPDEEIVEEELHETIDEANEEEYEESYEVAEIIENNKNDFKIEREEESCTAMEEYLEEFYEEHIDDSLHYSSASDIEQKDVEQIETKEEEEETKQYTQEDLTKALNEIKSMRGVNESAEKYNIPKLVIYSKLREDQEYRSVYRSIRGKIIDEAVRAVVENGLSLKESSAQYNVSKTVLWRNLKLSALYKPEEKTHANRTEAIEAIERGETLISISKKFNIPLSTLHRDKVRLFAQGKLPEHCKLTKRDGGPGFKNRLRAAVKSCENGMSQKLASEIHNIPKTTIWRHLQQASKSNKGCTNDDKNEEIVIKI